MALQLHEQTVCGGCGHSIEDSVGPQNMGWFETAEYECNGCAVLDKKTRSESGGQNDPKTRHKVYVKDARQES